jgi:hypothetical protein
MAVAATSNPSDTVNGRNWHDVLHLALHRKQSEVMDEGEAEGATPGRRATLQFGGNRFVTGMEA